MDTKRQQRRRYVNLLCVCILLLAVADNAEGEVQEGQRVPPPAGQGTKHTNTMNAPKDGDEKQSNKERGDGKQEDASQALDPSTVEIQDKSVPVPSSSQKQEDQDHVVNSPQPPDGESNSPPLQQKDQQGDSAPPVEIQEQQPELSQQQLPTQQAEGNIDKLPRPDTPSGQDKITDGPESGDKIPGPKPGAETIEPETPNTGDGSINTDPEASPSDPTPHTPEGKTEEKSDSTSGTRSEEVQSPEEPKKGAEVQLDRVDEIPPEGEWLTPGEADADSEEGKTEEEPEPPKREQDLPSFDEWKEKIIAEQAEQAKQAKQEKMEAQASQQVNKKKVNYASMTCGAKLVVANPEAKNAASILNENKDQYMIQPCQAKKWFVVELCEPVAIQSLEIANLELFSSLPESFIVSTSERYPTKEWKNLGTFRARDERAVQSFPIMEEDMFSKYIKVEPLTHYGDEHYCPLTLVRVYGTTVVEDYEDSDHMDQTTAEEDSTLSESASQDEPSNLFTSATESSSGSITSWIDTVISLVKTVLSPGEKEKEVKIDDVVKMNATSRNKSLPNISHNLPPDGDQAAPCTPTTSSGAEPPIQGEVRPGKPLPVTPEASDHPPIVTLIESHPHTLALSDLIGQCNFCQDLHQPSCYSDRSHVCGYYRATNFVLGTSCACKMGPRSKEETEKMEKRAAQMMHPKSKPAETKPDAREEADASAKASTKESKAAEEDAKRKPHGVPVSSSENLSSSPVLEPSVQGSASTPRAADRTDVPTLQTSVPTPGRGTDGTLIIDSIPKTNIPSPTLCDPSQTDCNTMGPDIVQIRPTSTDEAGKTLSEAVNIEETKSADDKMKSAEPPPVASPPEHQPGGAGSEGNNTGANAGMEKVIYADSPGSHDTEYDLEMLPPPDEGETITKLSSGRRENAFMRLKNRIKALELNLTLSSRYLEELSKRYRREMEDMYLSLNKTILKLTNTSRTAEQRDVRQQANITDLTKRIKHLTEQVETLKESLGVIHTQVIERHLFLMMVEFVLFLLIITWLLNRVHQPQRARVPAQPVATRVPITAPSSSTSSSSSTAKQVSLSLENKPPDKHKKVLHKGHRRRNSIDATPPRPRVPAVITSRRSKDDIHLRLSGSESRFDAEILDAVAAASSNPEFKEFVPKKKKKKKNKGLLASQSLGTIASASSYNPQPSTSATRVQHKDKVGLIFSSKNSDKRDTSPTNSSCSSESGEIALTNSSGLSAHGLGGKSKKQLTTRRSLDLKDLHKQHSDPGPLRKHRRLASDGVTNNGTSPVTNIGPLFKNNKTANGNSPVSDNSPSAAYSSTGWKTWLLGTRH